MTQVQFGEKIGLTGANIQTTVSHYENGSVNPSIETLEAMLKLIDLTLAQCLFVPEYKTKNGELHALLDRLLANEERCAEVERYVRIQSIDVSASLKEKMPDEKLKKRPAN